MPELNLEGKRPPKQISVIFIVNQYGSLKAGIPGLTSEIIGGQIANGNFYLYESEVKELLEAKKDEKDFDAKDFVAHLKAWKCVKAGSTPALGEGVVRIDSLERAKEVANPGVDPAKIVDLMSKMTKLRDELEPLINQKSSCSIALKNKKILKKKKEKAQE